MRNFTRSVILGLLLFCLSSIAQAQFNGFALYNEQNSSSAFLIDANGNIAHRWNGTLRGNYAVLMKENGNIVRGVNPGNNTLNGAAVGGMVQELDSLANVVWDFRYSNADHVQHHDITLLPNGNVLLIAWEVKDQAELQAAGFTGTQTTRWPTHIVEVQQDGTTGQIVWEWHIWDHMVQDVDSTKPNYGVVADHPELLNINVTTSGGGGGPGGRDGDWFHVNGIDYNADLDQIAFTSRYLSEIFIIDHSTTTAEAASHSGGNAGKGGDFLFRWGNPANHGASGSKLVAGAVHDVRWIDPSIHHNYGGYLQYFNNVGGPGGGSAVDAILPQLAADGYNYVYNTGIGYEPVISYDFRHVCRSNASGQSASNRMPDGNVFVNLSRGYMYEVDSLDNLVWQYNAGPAKAFRYTCEFPGIIQLLNDPCGVATGVEDELKQADIRVYPNPAKETLYLSLGNSAGIAKLDQTIITDIHGKVVARFASDSRVMDVSSFAPGMYFVQLDFGTAGVISKKVSIK
ncbi:MAG: aryl-sulfate sulfotransferase [Bacteroidia bacterium]